MSPSLRCKRLTEIIIPSPREYESDDYIICVIETFGTLYTSLPNIHSL